MEATAIAGLRIEFALFPRGQLLIGVVDRRLHQLHRGYAGRNGVVG